MTQITKEAIEAVLTAIDGERPIYVGRKEIEFMLEAALSTLPIAGEGKVTAIADELTDALDGAFVTTTSGGGQRPYLSVMFPDKNQVSRLYDALAAFSSLRRTQVNTPRTDADSELLEVLKELCTRIGPRWFLEQNWSAPLDAIAKAEEME